MKNKVFLIIGKSFSGKDTLLNEILNDEFFCKKYNLKKFVRYTTRKKRPNERNGEDYFFIDENGFIQKYKSNVNNDKYIIDSYTSEFGCLHYVSDFTSLEPDKNYILTGSPEMIEPYKEILGENNLCVIYLIPPNYALFERFGTRDDNKDYMSVKYKEIYRRFIDDLYKFNKSNSFMSNTNCIINLGKDVHIEDIKKQMISFINRNEVSIILNNKGNYEFSNKYIDDYICSSQDIKNYQIKLCNGNLILNTEDETLKVL